MGDHHQPPSMLERSAIVLLTIIFTAAICWALFESEAEAGQSRRGTVAYCKQHAVDKAKRACIIRVVFAPIGQARKALRVATCESGLNPRAKNGQYLGMFQVSAAWRRDVPGFGRSPEQQAWHARRVVEHPQGGWSHWDCQ